MNLSRSELNRQERDSGLHGGIPKNAKFLAQDRETGQMFFCISEEETYYNLQATDPNETVGFVSIPKDLFDEKYIRK